MAVTRSGKIPTMGSNSLIEDLENEEVPFEVQAEYDSIIPNRALVKERCAEVRKDRTETPRQDDIILVLLKRPVVDVTKFATISRSIRETVMDSPMLNDVLHAIGWVLGEQTCDDTGVSAEECCIAAGVRYSVYRDRFRRLCKKSLVGWQWQALKAKCQCL